MNNKHMNGIKPEPPKEEVGGKVPCTVLKTLAEHNACAAIMEIGKHPGFQSDCAVQVPKCGVKL